MIYQRRYFARRAVVGLLVAPLTFAPMSATAEPASPDCGAIWQTPDHGSFYESNPTYTDVHDDAGDWEQASPESRGLDPGVLNEGVDELFANERSLLSIIVVRDGSIVLERYDNGGDRFSANNVHSASKVLIHALAGIAVEEGHIGSLDDTVATYLPAQFDGESDEWESKREITLRHLLTQRSGLSWAEDSTEYAIESSDNWVEAILARDLIHEPGGSFTYSTGNTHVVSAVIAAATGSSTCEYAHDALLSRLNITAEHWGMDPNGVFSGGFNVYLTPRELAKIGLVFEQGGQWRGEQVIPEWVIRDAFTEYTEQDSDGFGYSTGWWTRKIRGYDMYLAWGWGGQFVYVVPALDLVFSTTQNTSESPFVNDEIDSGAFVRDVLLAAVRVEPVDTPTASPAPDEPAEVTGQASQDALWLTLLLGGGFVTAAVVLILRSRR